MASFIAKYKEVSNQILSGMEQDDWDVIASERELSKQFDVSRTTIRKALTLLEERGKIKKIEGKGYVKNTSLASFGIRTQMHLHGFYADIIKQGHKLQTEVLACVVKEADMSCSQRLGIALGERIIYLVRRRSIDGKCYSLTTSYLPYDLCCAILGKDLRHGSLWEMLQADTGSKVHVQKQSIYARKIAKEEARQLDLALDSTVMVVNHIAYMNKRIVEDSTVVSDVFSMRIENQFS